MASLLGRPIQLTTHTRTRAHTMRSHSQQLTLFNIVWPFLLRMDRQILIYARMSGRIESLVMVLVRIFVIKMTWMAHKTTKRYPIKSIYCELRMNVRDNKRVLLSLHFNANNQHIII